MRKIIFLICLIAFLFCPTIAFASFDPVSVSNNKFGIHIIDESDLKDAANLVNSSGGDWGYVTLVIREDQMDRARWQKAFDTLRDLHLIPIVRIATSTNKTGWKKPTEDDASKWADFLNSLNWVIENRYVVLFNEPNHDKEWGGQSNPVEYAKVAKAFRSKLKEKSNDFFILPAGLDVDAANTSGTMDAYLFWERMASSEPDIFKQFDGWNSHSYPNPGFQGAVDDSSRRGVRSFTKEIEFLEKFGLKRNIPVFITETGWIHSSLSKEEIADNFVKAYETVWNNPQVIAVTPFVLNYSQAPFDLFAWKSPTGDFYPQYQKVKQMKKDAGEPKQLHSLEWIEEPIPEELFIDSHYILFAKVKNTGQSIWDGNNAVLDFESNFPKGSVKSGPIPKTLPGQIAEIEYFIDTPNVIQINTLSTQLKVNGHMVGEEFEARISLVPPTTLAAHVKLALRRSVTANDFQILIYEGVRFVKRIENVNVTRGIAIIKEIRDLVPEKTYRFVLTKEYYLPVQAYEVLDENQTVIDFPVMLPIDLDNDGALSIKDIFVAWANPLFALKLWNPIQ